jgi:hypothetical protein
VFGGGGVVARHRSISHVIGGLLTGHPGRGSRHRVARGARAAAVFGCVAVAELTLVVAGVAAGWRSPRTGAGRCRGGFATCSEAERRRPGLVAGRENHHPPDLYRPNLRASAGDTSTSPMSSRPADPDTRRRALVPLRPHHRRVRRQGSGKTLDVLAPRYSRTAALATLTKVDDLLTTQRREQPSLRAGCYAIQSDPFGPRSGCRSSCGTRSPVA